MNYTYSTQQDTPNNKVNPRKLEDEIISNALDTQISGVSVAGDIITIAFNAALSNSDKISLDNIVGNHEGSASVREPEEVKVVSQDSLPPFSSKTLPNNKSLFSRVVGVKYSLTAGSNICAFSVPWPECKITGIEIINGELLDTTNLFIKDSSTGTYSGVSNYTLNQFGFNVGVGKDYYLRESNYDADLYYGMVISVEYNSISDKDIIINYLIHEVK